MAKFEIVDVEVSPEQEPLFRALKECGVRYPCMRNLRVLAETLTRLIEPPESLQIPTGVRTEQANSLLNEIVPFEGDMAARMLQLDAGQPNPDAKWNTLSRSERKRARRMWTWALDAGLDTSPQGRPPKIDSALVLYCARVVAEGCGQPYLKFSKPPGGGPPRGPMWRVLMAALPLAQRFLCSIGSLPRESQQLNNSAETVAGILKTAGSVEFRKYSVEQLLGPSANDVAAHPASVRLAFSLSRKLRKRARRKNSVP